jgi:hypothetical protein
MSGLHTKVTKTGLAALKAAASESLDAELLRYASVLRASGRKDDAALADYWAGVVASAGPAAEVCNAFYAAIRIGAAVERANAERAFTEPVLRRRKAVADRAKATAASAPAKKAAADKSVRLKFDAFAKAEREQNPRIGIEHLHRKFSKTLGRREAERFRRLITPK